jgi:hypothetical protein
MRYSAAARSNRFDARDRPTGDVRQRRELILKAVLGGRAVKLRRRGIVGLTIVDG